MTISRSDQAYGFSVENAYVEDRRTGRGFFLSVVVYTNPDGVLSPDEFAEIARDVQRGL